MTVFGKSTCPSDYVSDYTGYGFASYHGHYKTDFICIDDKPERFGRRGTSNDDQARMYPMETRCGTLTCPPYTNYREVLCAQCSLRLPSCPLYVDGQTCVSSCPATKYADSAKRCQACYSECDGCTGGSWTDCTACLNYNLKSNVQSISSKSAITINLDDGTSIVIDQNDILVKGADGNRLGGKCVSACPEKTVANALKECVPKTGAFVDHRVSSFFYAPPLFS